MVGIIKEFSTKRRRFTKKYHRFHCPTDCLELTPVVFFHLLTFYNNNTRRLFLQVFLFILKVDKLKNVLYH